MDIAIPIPQRRHLIRVRRGLLAGTLALAMSVGLYLFYQQTALAITVEVDGVTERVRTHRATVGDLLDDLGLELHTADDITPNPDTLLTHNTRVQVARAPRFVVLADGLTLPVASQATTSRQLLADAGIAVGPYDELWAGDSPIPLDADLAALALPMPDATEMQPALTASAPADALSPTELTLRRAVPLVVRDGNNLFTIQTTAPTIGEALLRENITLYLGDLVQPSLGTETSSGLHVMIARSSPIVIHVDGKSLSTRTRQQTVGDALAEQGVAVMSLDRVMPGLNETISDNMEIQITRVREEVVIVQDVIDFETFLAPDDELEIDHQRVSVEGQAGITNHRYRAVYEDGQEVNRYLEDSWVAQEPQNRIISYGRKIVLRTLETPNGSVQYWRKIRMLATSYSAATAGVSPSSAYYGRTRLGDIMRFGLVAVDPSVIPLRSNVYVAGYGEGYASDTGGAIIGRRIDLGYDDNNLKHWYSWVDVYVLAPAPPASQIRWILPNWPREP